MDEREFMVRGEEASGLRSPQSRKRRASAITVRIQTRGPEARLVRTRESQVAARGLFPEPVGSLLLVQDRTQEGEGLVRAARLAGLEVLQAGTPEEALRILMEKEFPVDLLFLIDPPSGSSSFAVLIRRSLEIRPGLQVLMRIGSGRTEEMRAGYDAGAASIILHDTPEERLALFLKQSLSVAREGQRRDLRRREREVRHASDSPARRGMRKIRIWMDAPSGSRRKTRAAAIAAAAVSLLIGVGLAYSLEGSYRADDRSEAMMNRILERMNRAKASDHPQDTATQVGLQQIRLAGEANEASRRYYQDHLQELRWQNYSRSSMPSEAVPTPAPDRGLYSAGSLGERRPR